MLDNSPLFVAFAIPLRLAHAEPLDLYQKRTDTAVTTTIKPQRYVIAGGSGFLGISLATKLTSLGHHVTILSRNKPRPNGPWQHVTWDGRTAGEWIDVLEGSSGLINLAGRSVDCIKTPDHQDEILRSRVESTQVLGAAMGMLSSPPPVWVQMGTAHIYGDPPTSICTEQSSFGVGLAPTVGQAWEAALHKAVLPSQRAVVLRTSFVLGKDRGAGGGALTRLAKVVRWGLGGRIGSGTQGMSWLHEADMNALFLRALEDDTMQGAYITSSPNPVSQSDFMRTLRKVLGVPIGLPAFSWMVRLGAHLILRTDPDLALYGRYVIPRRLQEANFQFQFPLLEDALRDLLARPTTSLPTNG